MVVLIGEYKHKVLTPATIWVNLENIILRGDDRHKSVYCMKCPGQAKTDQLLSGPGGGKWGLIANGYKFSSWDGENVLEVVVIHVNFVSILRTH